MQIGDAYAQLVQQYGEEDARYIWESMHPTLPDEVQKAVFIDLAETAQLRMAEVFRAKAKAAGKQYTRLEGDIRLIRNLTFGQWDPTEFLIVPAGAADCGGV